MRTLRLSLLVSAVAILVLPGTSHGQVAAKPPQLGFAGSLERSPQSAQKSIVPAIPNSYGKLPFSFEINAGQTASEVKFIARGPGYALFLTPDQAVLSLRAGGQAGLLNAFLPDAGPASPGARSATLRMKLRGANPEASIVGTDELPGKTNYFIGNDPKKWRTDVSTYAKIKVHEVYPGVDLVYYGHQGQLEYDFIVSPGADPNEIRLDLSGARKLWINTQGDLVMQTDAGQVRLEKPVLYQYKSPAGDDRQGAKQQVDGHFRIRGKNEIAFVAGSYDRSKALIIDPNLLYSTFLGGSANDAGVSIAVDASGNAYVTGGTVSADFPTSGAVQSKFGGASSSCTDALTKLFCGDAFVTEINAAGTAVVFSTYLGGNDADTGTSIALDSSNNIYVGGDTRSANFPVAATSFQPAFGGGTCHQGTRPCDDGFVAKLGPGGSTLIYSTFIGGNRDDTVFGLAVDANGNAFVTGITSSPNFPTTANAISQTLDGDVANCNAGLCPDAFVAEVSFNAASNTLSETYGTYLGGSASDVGFGIAVDGFGDIFVAGSTNSTNFPGITTASLQPTFAGGPCASFTCGDGFVAELTPGTTSTTFVFATYLGGSGDDAATTVALDPFGDVFVSGITDSPNFPTTTGAAQTTFGGGSASCANRVFSCGDAFAVAINPFAASGPAFIYSTYVGGSGDDGSLKGAAVDSLGNFYIAGTTNSPNFPTVSPIQAAFGGGSANCDASNEPCGDGFVTVIAPSGKFIFSSYLGGSGDDGILGLALDPNANMYLTGVTGSVNFPTTPGALKTTCGTDSQCNGLTDAFVAKMGFPVFKGPYQTGEIFVSGGNGIVYVFQQDGTVLGVMNTGQIQNAGMAFDQTGNLYVTTFNLPTGVVKFDQNANLIGPFGSFPSSATGNPESILFNLAGDALVGVAQTPPVTPPGPQPVPVFEFDAQGNLLATFQVLQQSRGSDWIELLADQQNLLYTSEGTSVKSFNISTNTQNPDFATGLPGFSAFALRVLPDNTVLVADSTAALRLSSAGQIQKTYTPNPPPQALFALNLDPDGKSFWTADLLTGNIFKFDIASGTQEAFFNSPVGSASGLAIFGEKAAGTNNLTVTENGNGTGTVTSNPAGIHCPSVCLAPFADNSAVTLTATAASGSTFGGFSANCTPVAPPTNPPSCTVAIGTSDVTVTATFSAAVATLTVAPGALNFGAVAINTTSQSQAVTLSVPSNSAPVTISAISVPTGFTETDNCKGVTIQPNTACTINVTFAPTTTGAFSGNLSITDTAGGSPQTVALTGTGVSGVFTVAPASLDFGTVVINTTSAAQTVTVTNGTTSNVSVNSITVPQGFNQTSNCISAPLTPNSSCTINVTFTPTSATIFSGNLTILDSISAPPPTVALSGTGSNSTFSITLGPGSTNTVNTVPGGTAIFGIVISGSPGQTITLGCAPDPSAAPFIVCNVTPPSVTTSANTRIAVVVSTFCRGSLPGFEPTSGLPSGGIRVPLLAIALVATALIYRRRPRWALSFAMLTLVALGGAACGAPPRGANGPTPPGAYKLTLTATAGSQVQTLDLVLKVQ